MVATNALDEGEAGEVGSKPTWIVEGIDLDDGDFRVPKLSLYAEELL